MVGGGIFHLITMQTIILKKNNNNSKCAFKRRKDALYNLKSVACPHVLGSNGCFSC
jgi:hypothetical protein